MANANGGSYQGKWRRWIQCLGKRWVVAEFRDDLWRSKNTEAFPGHGEEVALSLPELVHEKKIRTYANKNAAIKALKRVYNPADADQARPQGDEGHGGGHDMHRA